MGKLCYVLASFLNYLCDRNRLKVQCAGISKIKL